MFSLKLYIDARTVYIDGRRVRQYRPQERVINASMHDHTHTDYARAWTAAQAFNGKQEWKR